MFAFTQGGDHEQACPGFSFRQHGSKKSEGKTYPPYQRAHDA